MQDWSPCQQHGLPKDSLLVEQNTKQNDFSTLNEGFQSLVLVNLQ
jgi:hypothetical protein